MKSRTRKFASPFDKWFYAQFGDLPVSDDHYNEMRAERDDIRSRLSTIQHKIEQQDQLFVKYNAAMKAYTTFKAKE